MSKLACDICGGKLVVQSGGIAVCEDCGIECSKDRLREKINLDGSGVSQLSQSDKWNTLANEAYLNGNYREAYMLYCKILEDNPLNWEATYKKGICIARESNLANVEINQAVYGVLDAIPKLNEETLINDEEYSIAIMDMIADLNSLHVDCTTTIADYVIDYGQDSEDAVNTFYMFEMYIAKGVEVTLGLFNEKVCFNHPSQKLLEAQFKLTRRLAEETIECLNTEFTCLVGGHFTIFDNWKDDYAILSAPDSAIEIKKELESELSASIESFDVWMKARNNSVDYNDVVVMRSKFKEELNSINSILKKIEKRTSSQPELVADDEVERFTNFYIPKIVELIKRYEDATYDNEENAYKNEIEQQIKETLISIEKASNELIAKFNSLDLNDVSAELSALQKMLTLKGY